jgi:hypothetical protein
MCSARLAGCHYSGFQGEGSGVDSHEPPKESKPDLPVRTLKIEADGDRWKGIKPKIRLMGQWLERAGFKPGTRVSVRCLDSGVIELRSQTSKDE